MTPSPYPFASPEAKSNPTTYRNEIELHNRIIRFIQQASRPLKDLVPVLDRIQKWDGLTVLLYYRNLISLLRNYAGARHILETRPDVPEDARKILAKHQGALARYLQPEKIEEAAKQVLYNLSGPALWYRLFMDIVNYSKGLDQVVMEHGAKERGVEFTVWGEEMVPFDDQRPGIDRISHSMPVPKEEKREPPPASTGS